MSNFAGSHHNFGVTPDGVIAKALRAACKEAGLEVRIVEPTRSNAGLTGYRALARQMRVIMKEAQRLEKELKL